MGEGRDGRKAAERAGEMFARGGSRRYFAEVEDRSVYGDLAAGSGHLLPSGEPADGGLSGIADGFRRGMERAGNPLPLGSN